MLLPLMNGIPKAALTCELSLTLTCDLIFDFWIKGCVE
jgi:hypothetical protein